MTHHFAATIIQNDNIDAAYIVVPIDIRKEYGKGRLKVSATFDGAPYNGSVVNMGVKDSRGDPCYIIGVPKAIRKQIGKTFGDSVDVTLWAI